VVENAYNPSTQEDKAGLRVQSQPGLHSEIRLVRVTPRAAMLGPDLLPLKGDLLETSAFSNLLETPYPAPKNNKASPPLIFLS
jgi:hypothetical protein